jgi:hypothetical protein
MPEERMNETKENTRENTRERKGAFGSGELIAYANERDGKMQAQISSFEKGLEIYPGISVIRVRGRRSSLTILEDYTPIVSKVDGDVDLIGKESFHTLKNIQGFFCHVHNVFFLILNETARPGEGAPEDEREEV